MSYVPPQCTSHIFSIRPLAPWWWPVLPGCIPWSDRSLQPPAHQPSGVTPTLRPTYADTSFLESSGSPDYGNPPTISAYILSPPNYRSHILVAYDLLIYRASHGPVPLVPSLSSSLRSSPALLILPQVVIPGCPITIIILCDLSLQSRLEPVLRRIPVNNQL